MKGVDVSMDWDIGEVFGKDMASIILNFHKLDSFNA
jgi:hypothetical protein